MSVVVRIAAAVAATVWAVAVALAGPTYRIEVAGLACPFCAYGVEKALNKIEGVESAETNLKEGTVIVTMRDGATLDEATAKEAVESAGFTLNGFKQIPAEDGS